MTTATTCCRPAATTAIPVIASGALGFVRWLRLVPGAKREIEKGPRVFTDFHGFFLIN